MDPIRSTHSVAMRDGVELATDVVLPGGSDGSDGLSRRPTVLVRTPYSKTRLQDPENGAWADWFASHGYAAVTQDCRGCFDSGGTVDFLWPEADDGADTAAWIIEQPWSDGRVATYGTSWSGWTQTAMAAAGAPGLAAIVPTMSGSCAFSSSVRQGGAIELRFIAWALWHSALNPAAHGGRDWFGSAALDAPGAAELFTALPLRRGASPLHEFPGYEDWALEIAQHDTFDGRWRDPAVWPVGDMDTFADVPMLTVGGWYDSYARATCELYVAARDGNSAPAYLIMGPWTHGTGQVEGTVSGDVSFGPDAALDSFRELHRSFYDEFLLGKDEGWATRPPVRIFVMGGGSGTKGPDGRLRHGGHWRDEPTWPLERARDLVLYLHGDATLQVAAPVSGPGSTTFDFDPRRPVPTIGGSLSSLETVQSPTGPVHDVTSAAALELRTPLVEPGGFDQWPGPTTYGAHAPYLPLNTRADVLSFRTEPLTDDLEVTGPVRVRLAVSTDCPDTDFTAKLIDVHPPSPDYPHGYALNLTDSIIRLRSVIADHRPGDVVEIEIELYPISNLFCRGHRIRLDVSSSNFPRFDVNPNTGEPAWTSRSVRVASNTVHHHGAGVSFLTLPVIPTPPVSPDDDPGR
ncbi:CocE/NonD family hydrolase [Propionibacteriaceae bacterium Y2011]|uniref:CocE/NonD family hydrolase n=1 Tax=Microlunatus sp. Y2014 TaxID=3418488 RepID=UPI003B4CD00F